MALKDFQNEIIVMNKEFVQDELGGMAKKWTEGICSWRTYTITTNDYTYFV